MSTSSPRLPRLASRLDDTPTVFATMSALAVETGAINLGQGFPDEDGPTSVLEAAAEALRGGRNQYPPSIGIPELRHAVAAHQRRYYGRELEPDAQVIVTAGATEAIAAAVLALVEPGDEVVAFEPFYDSYAATVAMAGGVLRPVTLRPLGDDAFALDPDELRAAIGPRTRAILLNTPHNPTGKVFTDTELTAVAEAAVEHDLVVVSDEVYEHLLFDGREHRPIATYPGMADRTVTISSVGKSFSLTGWKVGWVTGSAELVATVQTAKQWLTFAQAAPLQPAVAYALDHEDGFVRELATSLQAKRDLLCAGLAELGFGVSMPAGTYFAMTDVRPLGYDDGTAFCLDLPRRAGVVAVPAAAFYTDPSRGRHLVRWAFCKRTEVLQEALDRLRSSDLF